MMPLVFLYRRIFVLALAINISLPLIAGDRYFVSFKDKAGTQATFSEPATFLSARSVLRRQRQHLEIDSLDLPVSVQYINRLTQNGVEVIYTSKWLNGAMIELCDGCDSSIFRTFSFISGYKFAAPSLVKKSYTRSANEEYGYPDEISSAYDYGKSAAQIGQLKGQILHQNGFKGRNIHIAILDGGFWRADEIEAFDKLRSEKRLLGTRDWVNPASDVYAQNSHGMSVLSIMAADLPGKLLGSAPEASYWLLRTEDGASEYPIEEYNWVVAAEFADSAGVDIINSSLGYTRFDSNALSHTYKDMNGQASPASRAADVAASKGIVVVVSAGNERQGEWRYISAPADAVNILTVGAVDSLGVVSPFSSAGPTADGRVKPDVCARGSLTALIDASGNVSAGYGTSFSGPIISGLVACLWQAKPSLSALELIQLVRSTARNYATPDSLLGYGLANFEASSGLSFKDKPIELAQQPLRVTPNPFRNSFFIELLDSQCRFKKVLLFDSSGRLIINRDIQLNAYSSVVEVQVDEGQYRSGVYLLQVLDYRGKPTVIKLIKA